ncbi:MAG: RNA-binding S4 domain-containing protein [Bacteroidales bacterium]|nr:RNA-binding S4 domain-containing protein [Bacteroidales bacterium]
MRIDKWLWCVRIYKTRSLAAEACDLGRVMRDGATMKPSKEVNIGDVITINLNPLKKTVRVKAILKNRVGAKEVINYMEDLTPQAEYDKIEMMRMMYFEKRDSHTGRPTKKDRRNIEKFKDTEY